MIYDGILPGDRLLNFDTKDHWHSEDTMRAACKADKRLNVEIQSWAKKRCGLRIVIYPSSPLPRASIAFEKLRRIQLFIDYYDKEARELSMTKLHDNIARVVDLLAKSPGLQEVSIVFRDEPAIDRHWSTQRPDLDCSGHKHASFLTRMRPNGTPIVGYLLQPLRRLPICKKAVVLPLDRVTMIEELYDEPDEEFLDWSYMVKLFCSLEVWLEGFREDSFRHDWKAIGAARWQRSTGREIEGGDFS